MHPEVLLDSSSTFLASSTASQNNRPLYLIVLISICKVISFFLAGLHFFMIKIRIFNAPVYITKFKNDRLKTLCCIWHARLVRRMISFLVRTPLRSDILKLINVNVSIPRYQGCIIVMCHTPWKRLLTEWCLEKKFALIIGKVKSTDRRRAIQREGAGLPELHELVRYLERGGRVIVMADIFNNLKNCPLKFLGNDYNASVFAERLAILAKVPILTFIAKLSNARIEFAAGPQFLTDGLKSTSTIITNEIISFFEKEIGNDPAIFEKYVK